MKLYIASDHAGYEMKNELKLYLSNLGHSVSDLGADTYSSEDDYPDYAKLISEDISKNSESLGILICGTGQGEIMVANRNLGVRCALFYGEAIPKTQIDINGTKSDNSYEIVKLARSHNNANILALASRFIDIDQAKKAVSIFIETPFSNEERHVRRLRKF